MGTLPSPSQVARNHTPLYEAFYQQVDPAGAGCVTAVDAAAFLKRSGLSDGILSKVWDMSDPIGKGFLDKRGFFVALKLIALAQSGKDLLMANIALEVPPPQMKGNGRISPAVDWTVKVAEYKKYEEMFNSLVPVDNRLPGNKVKPVMLNSKLPLEILGKIWDLSDTDQDGFLTKEEFILAMHLTYKALENIPVPSVLPPELIAVLKQNNSPLGAVKVLPDVLPAGMDGTLGAYTRRSSTPSIDPASKTATWVINAIDKAKYDEIFHTLDTDVDGFVTGPDIRETLLQSGLTQAVLAHVWNLCDIKQNGKLNSEQFALAMYLIQQKLQGCEIPAVLFPEMIPPTLRPKPSSEIIQDGATLVISGESDSSGSKELDLISNEIKELQMHIENGKSEVDALLFVVHFGDLKTVANMEKMSLEKDIAQKEADVKIKNGELKNLQNELDALETMLKQLEIQKGEARKRLNDLDMQKISVDNMFADVNARTEEERCQVESIKKQVEEQQLTLETQEQELNTKRQELSDLRQEEGRLEAQIKSGRSQLETLTKSLQDTQLQISQMKLKIDQAQEQHRLMTDAIQQLDAALASGEFGTISEFTLTAITPISEVELEHFPPLNGVNGDVTNDFSAPLPVEEFQDDPFKSKDPFNNRVNGFSSDPFADDPFKSDPFKEKDVITSDDPFTSDPFEEVFGVNQSDSKEDPFQGSDPFGSFAAPPSSTATNDPFDPFGLTSGVVSESPIKIPPNADPFGADPFGPNPTAPPRPESPTPALPPKKSKAPPPRPAPPKVSSGPVKSGPTRAAPAPPIPPPTTTAVNDPFANAAEAITVTSSQAFPDIFSITTVKSDDSFDPFSSSAGVQQADFANFADFDNAK